MGDAVGAGGRGDAMSAGATREPAPASGAISGLVSTAAVVAVILGGWWLMIWGLKLDPLSAKTPADVFNYVFTHARAAEHRAELAAALGKTLRDALLGYLAGMMLGALLAAGTSLSRTLERAVLPLAMVLRSVPLVALTPIITLAFGHGLLAVTAVAAIVVFFPTYVNVLLGLRSTPREMRDLIDAYGGSRLQAFLKVQVPSAVPALMASARIAVPAALIGVIIAEWLVSGKGVGQYMIESQHSLDYGALWSAAVGLTVASALLYALVGWLERIVLQRIADR
jgi:ABC-type nitrate/sulfonate/bicarbonate transport system permease component